MAETQPQPTPQPVTVNTGPGALVTTGVQAAEVISRWSPTQVVIIGCVLSMVVTNGLLVWTMVNQRTDKADERRSAADREALVMRSVEDQRERDRIAVAQLSKDLLGHCKDQQKDILTVHTQEREKDRTFQADINEKNRAAIVSLTGVINGMRLIVEKLKEEDIELLPVEFPFGIPMPMPRVTAPMPREKLTNSTVLHQEVSHMACPTVLPVVGVPPAGPD